MTFCDLILHPHIKSVFWDGKKWAILKTKSQKRGKCQALYCRRNSVVTSTGYERAWCHRCRKRLWRLNNPILNSYCNLRSSAKRRGLEFDLDFEYFKSLAEEAGYGLKFYSGEHITGQSPSVDRIDNYEGYLNGNIQILSISENSVKGTERKEKYKFKPTDNEPF